MPCRQARTRELRESGDIPGERLVQEGLTTLLADRTAVIIAHRLSLLEAVAVAVAVAVDPERDPAQHERRTEHPIDDDQEHDFDEDRHDLDDKEHKTAARPATGRESSPEDPEAALRPRTVATGHQISLDSRDQQRDEPGEQRRGHA
jgi:hypothetical protein